MPSRRMCGDGVKRSHGSSRHVTLFTFARDKRFEFNKTVSLISYLVDAIERRLTTGLEG